MNKSKYVWLAPDSPKCEVQIKFLIPTEKVKYIFKARDKLAKAGITFDTGGYSDGKITELDWEFDWSLKGAEVYFRRFREHSSNYVEETE